MGEIQDFYLDPKSGKKWIPQRVSDSHVYCRSEFYGNVSHGIFKIGEDGEFGTKIVKSFQSGTDAMAYLRDHSEGLARQFVPSEVRKIVAEAADCDTCVEDVHQWNVDRLAESRKARENGINELNTE